MAGRRTASQHRVSAFKTRIGAVVAGLGGVQGEFGVQVAAVDGAFRVTVKDDWVAVRFIGALSGPISRLGLGPSAKFNLTPRRPPKARKDYAEWLDWVAHVARAHLARAVGLGFKPKDET